MYMFAKNYIQIRYDDDIEMLFLYLDDMKD